MLFYTKPLKNTFTIQNKDKKEEESKVLFYFLILDEVLLMDAICLAPTFGLNNSGVLDRGAKQLLKPAAAAAAAATNASCASCASGGATLRNFISIFKKCVKRRFTVKNRRHSFFPMIVR